MQIKGYVFGDGGSAVSGVDVAAIKAGESSAAASTSTDGDGIWEFTDLDADQYTVEIDNDGQMRIVKPDVIWQAENILDLEGNWKFKVGIGEVQPYHFEGNLGQKVEPGDDTEFAAEMDQQSHSSDNYVTALSGTFNIDGRYRVKFEIKSDEDDYTTFATIEVGESGTFSWDIDWSETYSTDFPMNDWQEIVHDFSEFEAVNAGDSIRIRFRGTNSTVADVSYIRNIQILGDKSPKDEIPEFNKD